MRRDANALMRWSATHPRLRLLLLAFAETIFFIAWRFSIPAAVAFVFALDLRWATYRLSMLM